MAHALCSAQILQQDSAHRRVLQSWKDAWNIRLESAASVAGDVAFHCLHKQECKKQCENIDVCVYLQMYYIRLHVEKYMRCLVLAQKIFFFCLSIEVCVQSLERAVQKELEENRREKFHYQKLDVWHVYFRYNSYAEHGVTKLMKKILMNPVSVWCAADAP